MSDTDLKRIEWTAAIHALWQYLRAVDQEGVPFTRDAAEEAALPMMDAICAHYDTAYKGKPDHAEVVNAAREGILHYSHILDRIFPSRVVPTTPTEKAREFIREVQEPLIKIVDRLRVIVTDKNNPLDALSSATGMILSAIGMATAVDSNRIPELLSRYARKLGGDVYAIRQGN